MVSELARRDAEKLRSAGVELSLADCVRLNALGLMAERGGRQYQPFLLPRVALVAGLVLREPTLGQQLWCDTLLSYAEFSNRATELCASAYAYSTATDELPDPLDYAACKTAIEALYDRIKDKVTPRVLSSALLYVAAGLDPHSDEFAPAPRNAPEIVIPEGGEVSIALGVLLDGTVLELGITMAEARNLTRAQVEKIRHDAIISRLTAQKIKLRDIEEMDRKNHYKGYLRFFEQLRKRGKEGNA